MIFHVEDTDLAFLTNRKRPSIIADDDGRRFVRYRKYICGFMYTHANDEWIDKISEGDVVIIEECLHGE